MVRGGELESTMEAWIGGGGAGVCALLAIGLNRFRRINDLLGYEAGDEALAEVGRRIGEWLPVGGVAARLGGDEYAVALPGCGEGEGEEAARTLLERLQAGMVLRGHEFHMTASAGMSVHPFDGGTARVLLRRATAAMRRAKQCGGSSLQRAVRPETRLPEEGFKLESAMRGAMERGELGLRYQPQVDRNGCLKGLEALIEWRSRELGKVETETFIHLAEETGAITEIGEWVLRTACRQVSSWREAGHETPRVAVNVSPQQFAGRGFVETVRAVLAETGLGPGALELEITESSILRDIDESASRMTELREMGVRIAIDDFGVGYSPLAYLHRLPLDVVKVDRSFVSQIALPSGSLPVVHTITVLAHHRGLEVVAEGVETEGQLELVRAARCDLVQGYLISNPKTASEVSALMAAPERLAAHTQARTASHY